MYELMAFKISSLCNYKFAPPLVKYFSRKNKKDRRKSRNKREICTINDIRLKIRLVILEGQGLLQIKTTANMLHVATRYHLVFVRK